MLVLTRFFIHIKMKKNLFGCAAFLAMFALSIGIFPQKIEAIYRGISTAQFSQFKQNTPRNMARGYRGIRTRTKSTMRKSSFSDNTEQRSARRTTGMRKSFSRKNISAKKNGLTHSFSANDLESFSIKLPRDFKKTTDTLTWSNGDISFAKTDSTIKIRALGNVCEGGTVFVQDCLEKVSDERTDGIQKEWPSGIVREKKITQLRWTGEYRFDQANAGKWFLIDVEDKKIGVLTFFDLQKKYVWQLEIMSPDSKDGILNDPQVIDTMKESLFVSEETSKPSSRILQRVQENKTTRLRPLIGRRSNTETISSKDVNMYEAKHVPFEIEVPKEFSLFADTLDRSSGKLRFVGKEGTIELKALETICSNQSSSITRKCIEKFGSEQITALKKAYPLMSNLGTNNYRLQLTKSSSMLSVARGALLMSGMERVATFVFAEPETGYMWQMNIVSNTGQRGVLGDIRKVRKLITSLRFGKE